MAAMVRRRTLVPPKSRYRTSLHGGDACPECQKGKVNLFSDPAVLVRIVGMAPLSATVYEQEGLRCNLCGEVFTAPAPEGVGSEK